MTQLDSIRYEVQNLSRFTPGQFNMRPHDTGNYDLNLQCYNRGTLSMVNISQCIILSQVYLLITHV